MHRQSIIDTINLSELNHQDEIIVGYGRKRKWKVTASKVEPPPPPPRRGANAGQTRSESAEQYNSPTSIHPPPPQAGLSRQGTPSPQPGPSMRRTPSSPQSGPSGLQARSPPPPPSRQDADNSARQKTRRKKTATPLHFTCHICDHVTCSFNMR